MLKKPRFWVHDPVAIETTAALSASGAMSIQLPENSRLVVTWMWSARHMAILSRWLSDLNMDRLWIIADKSGVALRGMDTAHVAAIDMWLSYPRVLEVYLYEPDLDGSAWCVDGTRLQKELTTRPAFAALWECFRKNDMTMARRPVTCQLWSDVAQPGRCHLTVHLGTPESCLALCTILSSQWQDNVSHFQQPRFEIPSLEEDTVSFGTTSVEWMRGLASVSSKANVTSLRASDKSGRMMITASRDDSTPDGPTLRILALSTSCGSLASTCTDPISFSTVYLHAHLVGTLWNSTVQVKLHPDRPLTVQWTPFRSLTNLHPLVQTLGCFGRLPYEVVQLIDEFANGSDSDHPSTQDFARFYLAPRISDTDPATTTTAGAPSKTRSSKRRRSCSSRTTCAKVDK